MVLTTYSYLTFFYRFFLATFAKVLVLSCVVYAPPPPPPNIKWSALKLCQLHCTLQWYWHVLWNYLFVFRSKEIDDDSFYQVVFGATRIRGSEPSESKVKVKRTIKHPDYVQGSSTYDNDIALAELESPVTYTDYIKPICLPQSGQSFPLGSHCWLTGWGSTKPQGRLLSRLGS